MDIYVAFTFLAWIIMLLWALMYTFLWTRFFHLGVQFLSHIVMLCLCINNGHTFYTKPLHHFPHPPSMNEGFKISTSLSTLVICLCCYSLSRAVQWFSLSFSWWLMILNIFSWSYWFSLDFWGSLGKSYLSFQPLGRSFLFTLYVFCQLLWAFFNSLNMLLPI